MYYFYYVAGWHHRVNKQNGAGLGFYSIVPLLRQEAQLVKLQVDSGDLDRTFSCVMREAALKKCWTEYMDDTDISVSAQSKKPLRPSTRQISALLSDSTRKSICPY